MKKLFKSVFDTVVDDVIGDTSWHGDTGFDEQSFENVEQAEILLLKLLDRVEDNANLPENAISTASGQKLQKQAQAILNNIKEQLS